jgi:hypothetical protein
MSPEATVAHEYWKEYKKQRISQHKDANKNEKPCSGLTSKEWNLMSIRQKSTFSKGKRYSYTRLWNHRSVPTEQGFKSLTINLI